VSAAPSFPRLQPPERFDEAMGAFLRSTKFYRDGQPLNAHRLLALHPPAGRALNRFLDWGEEAVLSPRERRLLILRTSRRTGCTYEWKIHADQGVRHGELSVGEVAAVDGDGSTEHWPPRERALLAVADAICARDTLDDSEWAQVSAVLSGPELIEALCIVGYYRMCAGLINALAVPDEGELDSSEEERGSHDHRR
jgi:alkylhydroperoxidase family enzyme